MMGKRLHGLAEILAGLVEKLYDWKFGTEAPWKSEEEYIDRQTASADAFCAKEAKSRAVSTARAIAATYDLLALWERAQEKGDPKAWETACKMAKVSKRTAENRLALLALSINHADLFKVIACLGRTKLYHIARLPESTLRQIDIGKIRAMTDRELLSYLREVAPVAKRKRVSGLRSGILRCLELAADEGRTMRLGRAELKLAARKSQELFGKLRTAYENQPEYAATGPDGP